MGDWGYHTNFKNEIVVELHARPYGLRWSELRARINKNREKQSKRPMSRNTLKKYLDILEAEGEIAKLGALYTPMLKMVLAHTRFRIAGNLDAALLQFSAADTQPFFDGVQHASDKELKCASLFLRQCADLIDWLMRRSG